MEMQLRWGWFAVRKQCCESVTDPERCEKPSAWANTMKPLRPFRAQTQTQARYPCQTGTYLSGILVAGVPIASSPCPYRGAAMNNAATDHQNQANGDSFG